jgi:hypothetical protein
MVMVNTTTLVHYYYDLLTLILGAQMAGSIRTIFWLCGYENVVQMIDDPAFKLEDELALVPLGTSPGDFLVSRYVEEGKIPCSVEQQAMGYVYEEPIAPQNWTVFTVPNIVQQTLSSRNVMDLYPWGRRQCLPQSVRVVSTKHLKDPEKFFSATENLFPDKLLSRNGVYFRGLSLFALELSMTFFIPTISQGSRSNEFGPGIYTTNDFDYAKRYAGANGAIMVFRDVDVRDVITWKPNEQEWQHLVAHYTLRGQGNNTVPEKHKEVDVIEGPVSATRAPNRPLKPEGNIYQRAFVSYRACERLASSLAAIIYIQN